MKKKIIKVSIYCLLISMILPIESCKKDYTNPSSVPEEQAFSSAQAMTGVVIGLQRVYTAGRGSSLYNRITLDGLLTKQLRVLNQGNTSEYQLELGGGSVDGTNTILGNLWTTSNKIIYDADNVINSAAALGDKGYASGLIGFATVFKASALGDLAMYWEKVPASIGQNVSFVNRADGFTKAIAAIESALAAISANPISSQFLVALPQNPAPPPINPIVDIVNSLHALKARYSIFIGNTAQALTAANAVNLSVRSPYTFSTVNLNPIFETATSTNNVYAPVDSTMGLPTSLAPNLADKRVPFYISTNASSPRFRVAGFGVASTTPWPIYLPGEITLIKAEAYARMATPDLVNALAELNKIVTKKAANDPFGVGADLPPLTGPFTQAEMLNEIYKHRGIELYMSGLRLEDSRRFGRPSTEKGRNFLPYPFLERDNNPNTPADPAF
jgi:starch-binding outer membrane protein, SusD/RagB family